MATGTFTVAEARVWLNGHVEKLTEKGKSLPEGVSLPSGRGRISAATRTYIEKQSRKSIVSTPYTATARNPRAGAKARLAEYVSNGGTLPEGVQFTAGRGRLSKEAQAFVDNGFKTA